MNVSNLTIHKGATFKQNILYQDSTGAAIPLTGYTARMQIRQSYQSDVLQELTTENGGITITALTGSIDLLITATDTALLPALTGVYDLEIITGTDVTRLLEGKTIITENVTR